MTYLGPQTATLTNTGGTTTGVALFADAGHSSGRVIWNDSAGVMYVQYGGSVSTTAYTVQVASQAAYAFPVPVYAGTVTALWATAGTARTTWW